MNNAKTVRIQSRCRRCIGSKRIKSLQFAQQPRDGPPDDAFFRPSLDKANRQVKANRPNRLWVSNFNYDQQ